VASVDSREVRCEQANLIVIISVPKPKSKRRTIRFKLIVDLRSLRDAGVRCSSIVCRLENDLTKMDKRRLFYLLHLNLVLIKELQPSFSEELEKVCTQG